ncbi:fumarylacetoacetate hydrolase family protein [Streptomyces sp. NPDC001787]|uniref:fumarylacetoacetate hydrolase family protein n=1 Tax=Streptomyces sp. NPDC001787 TaxID=3154523 RepID=UPI003330FFB2
MKLATVIHDTGEHAAVVLEEERRVILLDRAARILSPEPEPALESVLAIIEGGAAARAAADRIVADPPEEAVVRFDDVVWRSPLPRPPQIRDFGGFMDHFRNARARLEGVPVERVELPPIQQERPLYYVANRLAVAGHEAEVRWPPYSSVIDYELEFACVLGRGGMDITREAAGSHIFGYTIFNDFTARDTQREEISTGLGLSKSKDFTDANVLGPWIVTADELGDPYQLLMTARINGVEVSRGTSADMDHTFADMIAFTSTSTRLYPGEVLCSGTVPTGCGLEHGRFLQPGDTVELEVSGIGVLRNKVIAT